MLLFKKSISPVISIILLIMIVVVAVVGFSNWSKTYLSNILSDIDTENSNNLIKIEIGGLVGDDMYIINKGETNYSLNSLKLGDIDCSISQNLTRGVNKINVKTCISKVKTDMMSITVIGDSAIVSKTIYHKASDYKLIDCSNLNGGEWVYVPGNSILGTKDFCIMKYEAKNVGGFPTSQAALTPISLNQTDARAACSSLGVGYHLITDAEWVTVARLAENDPTNWADGIVGSTKASGGGMFSGNVNLNDNNSCGDGSILDGTVDGLNCLLGTRNKRTLNISGNLVWDLSGNVWEWTNDTFNDADSALGQTTYNTLFEWTQISGYDYLEPSNSSFNGTHVVGKVYNDGDSANPSGSVHGFLRGGGSYSALDGGVFLLGLQEAPSQSYGFRCAYSE